MSLPSRNASRRGEAVAITYFAYAACMTVARADGSARMLAAALAPVAIWGVGRLQPRRWLEIARDWCPLPLILVAYWQIQWFATHPLENLQQTWVAVDRDILVGFRLRAALESLGPVIPAILEGIYLSLYAIPALCLAAIYKSGRRTHVDRFLFTLLLGTFACYALLPHFPVGSPRQVFPGLDLPSYHGPIRTINLWLLDHLDITTGVFPSGHVAVAFGSAFGLLRVLDDRPLLCAWVFVLAVLVFTATVYCRYHYAMDGLVSFAISLAAWIASEALDPRE